MKYKIYFLLITLITSCSLHKDILIKNGMQNTNMDTTLTIVQQKFFKMYYDANYGKANNLFEAQPDSIKNNYFTNFQFTDETWNMIKSNGGMRGIAKEYFSTTNYALATNLTQLRYDFIFDKSGNILSIGVGCYSLGKGPINLSREEINKLLEFGRTLKFTFNTYYQGDYLFHAGYVLPLRNIE